MKGRVALIILLLFLGPLAEALEDLTILPGDVYLEMNNEGYDLFIRKKPAIQTILLVESTEDPARKAASYALRNPRYHPLNGDEKRLLNGEFLEVPGFYELLDSTPEKNERFETAFHIFIPFVVEYGNQWNRHGEIQMVDGTFVNIRAFSGLYGDYALPWKDNPYMFKFTQKPLEGPPEKNFTPEAEASYKEIVKENKGTSRQSRGTEDLIEKIDEVIMESQGKSLDLVIVLDTTKSMKQEIPYLRKELVPLVRERIKAFQSFRIGVVIYRDYGEEYLNKTFPFMTDLEKLQSLLNRISVNGGSDIPEAVHEALYEALRSYFWEAEAREILLIGDAPPHPIPRGKITGDMVDRKARELGVKIDTIVLPQ